MALSIVAEVIFADLLFWPAVTLVFRVVFVLVIIAASLALFAAALRTTKGAWTDVRHTYRLRRRVAAARAHRRLSTTRARLDAAAGAGTTLAPVRELPAGKPRLEPADPLAFLRPPDSSRPS